jgi:hypothetical protein
VLRYSRRLFVKAEAGVKYVKRNALGGHNERGWRMCSRERSALVDSNALMVLSNGSD